jgi:serine/threonine-protein kinase RsbW
VIISRWRGPAWRVVDADPGNVKLVRDWIGSVIARYGRPVDPADATLAVGELFTNAVTHGPGGRVLVGYCLWPGGARIVVCDGGSRGAPVLRSVTSTDEGGRGLLVVDAITEQWGCFSHAGHLIVWCDLGQSPRTHASDAWAWLHRVLSAGVPLSAQVSERVVPADGQVSAMVHPAIAGAGRGGAS